MSVIDETAAELDTLDVVIRKYVDRVLAATDGNKTRAAAILGIDLSTLYRWQHKWSVR